MKCGQKTNNSSKVKTKDEPLRELEKEIRRKLFFVMALSYLNLAVAALLVWRGCLK